MSVAITIAAVAAVVSVHSHFEPFYNAEIPENVKWMARQSKWKLTIRSLTAIGTATAVVAAATAITVVVVDAYFTFFIV